MGATIEAVATVRSRGRLHRRGAIELADRAALACLERAGRPASDVDFLINAGVYRDRNLGEPAIAALIQQDIGANPDPPLRGGHGTFSMDVSNGACGVLTALQILDGFIASGAIAHGLVVAADAPPQARDRRTFPFAAEGGAVLLGPAPSPDAGFTHFSSVTYPQHAHLFESYLVWEESGAGRVLEERALHRRGGRHVLHVHEAPEWRRECVACAVAAARSFLDTLGLRPHQVDLLVASPAPPSFPTEVGRALEIDPARVVEVERDGSETVHTAGIVEALETADRAGRLEPGATVLVVAVGAGVTVSLALYRPGPRPSDARPR